LIVAATVALAAFDSMTTRSVHHVTVICSAVMAIAFSRVLLIESEAWLAIGRALLQPFV